MILTLEEIKNYTRIDSEEEDELLKVLIHAAEEFLENATGKKYPMLEENGLFPTRFTGYTPNNNFCVGFVGSFCNK